MTKEYSNTLKGIAEYAYSQYVWHKGYFRQDSPDADIIMGRIQAYHAVLVQATGRRTEKEIREIIDSM